MITREQAFHPGTKLQVAERISFESLGLFPTGNSWYEQRQPGAVGVATMFCDDNRIVLLHDGDSKEAVYSLAELSLLPSRTGNQRDR